MGWFINADGYASTGQGFIGNNMFAYCGNNPVARQDTTGHFFGTILGGIIGAVGGAIGAALNGENVLVGALTGGLAGIAIGMICDLTVASGGVGAIVLGAIACGITAAGANGMNQYTNYRLQDKAKREAALAQEDNSSAQFHGSTANGQSQTVADRAFQSETFSDYVQIESICASGLTSAILFPVSVGGNLLISNAMRGDAFQSLGNNISTLIVSGGTSFLQIPFDLAGQTVTGVKK